MFKLGSKTIFGLEKYCVQKLILSKKNIMHKNVLVQKHFFSKKHRVWKVYSWTKWIGFKTILGLKKIWSERFLVREILAPRICLNSFGLTYFILVTLNTRLCKAPCRHPQVNFQTPSYQLGFVPDVRDSNLPSSFLDLIVSQKFGGYFVHKRSHQEEGFWVCQKVTWRQGVGGWPKKGWHH